MRKIIIVSNRLPTTVQKRKKDISFQPSMGGLATGLGSIYKKYDGVWIGWCGLTSESLTHNQKEYINENLMSRYNSDTIYLTRKDITNYYYGFCNRTIWPLFHYFTEWPVYEESMWKNYKHVNKMFCEAVLKHAGPDDAVWIQDYHLMLLPQLIRKKVPDIKIGFFLHIPFPSYEIFRMLPWKREILHGLLGSDLIGFHTYDYVRHFISSVKRILGYDHEIGRIPLENRMVSVDAFPMGIDYDKYAEASWKPEVQNEVKKFIRKIGDQKIVLSVDRLDYTKGIIERLHSFDEFLKQYPEYRTKVTMICVAVPSRSGVDAYIKLKKRLDQLVGHINGKYGQIGWMPVWYLYKSFQFDSLSALYHVSDVALVTPIRDGMNLIAKEFIAAKEYGCGVLILSEMAGAVAEMGEAIIVNPNRKQDVVDAIKKALEMPEDEVRKANAVMQERLKRYNINRWAEDFVGRLAELEEERKGLLSKRLSDEMQDQLIKEYKKSRKRLLLLDYDGTLIPFAKKPKEAHPDKELKTVLLKLCNSEKNEVVIISGRDRSVLEQWLGDLPLSFVAEHGVWIKEKEGEWRTIESMRQEWKESIRPIMELYVDRTPGSLLEEKDYSLVWHYRRTDPDLAAIRVTELKDALLDLTENLGLEVKGGNKILEIKSAGVHKGRAANRWLKDNHWEFILNAGDDVTDEDMFEVMPKDAWTINIGLQMSHARFSLETFRDLREVLKRLSEIEE